MASFRKTRIQLNRALAFLLRGVPIPTVERLDSGAGVVSLRQRVVELQRFRRSGFGQRHGVQGPRLSGDRSGRVTVSQSAESRGVARIEPDGFLKKFAAFFVAVRKPIVATAKIGIARTRIHRNSRMFR